MTTAHRIVTWKIILNDIIALFNSLPLELARRSTRKVLGVGDQNLRFVIFDNCTKDKIVITLPMLKMEMTCGAKLLHNNRVQTRHGIIAQE